MIAEAIDTAYSIGWAIAAWIAVAAAVVTIVLLAAAVTGVWVWRGVWRAVRRAYTAAWRAESTPCGSEAAEIAPGPAERRTARSVPSWAHTETYNRKEAA